MKLLKLIWRFILWVGSVIADLFKGPGNHYWDLGRILAFLGTATMAAGVGWNVHLGKPIDLGPGGLGGGLAAIYTAAGIYLAAKAWERQNQPDASKNSSLQAPPPAPPVPPPKVGG